MSAQKTSYFSTSSTSLASNCTALSLPLSPMQEYTQNKRECVDVLCSWTGIFIILHSLILLCKFKVCKLLNCFSSDSVHWRLCYLVSFWKHFFVENFLNRVFEGHVKSKSVIFSSHWNCITLTPVGSLARTFSRQYMSLCSIAVDWPRPNAAILCHCVASSLTVNFTADKWYVSGFYFPFPILFFSMTT